MAISGKRIYFSRYGGFRKTSKTEVIVRGQEKTEMYTGLYLSIWRLFLFSGYFGFQEMTNMEVIVRVHVAGTD